MKKLGFKINPASKLVDNSLCPEIHFVANLGEYTTGKALDGLFVKVGNQEKEIRKNPFQWASDIIQKVFGSVAGLLASN